MAVKYQSAYSGPEIDTAIRKVLYDKVGLADLNPQLIQEIKNWATYKQSVLFFTREAFPNPGAINTLYVATDELKLYLWNGQNYEEFKGQEEVDLNFDLIDCGGAI